MKNALEDISLSIGTGQTVAFVGPSGGGKSTLAALIARFFDPQSGKISIGGANVKDIDKSELMDTVSFVFQNSRLIKGSILDNVRMGKPNATDGEVLAALSAAQCMDIIEKFPDGVHTVIGSQGVYLSGGETQRLAIARAMLKNAPVLILDEATAFADPDNETKVQMAFNALAKGRTVIMIAHRLSTVVNADRIYVLKEGRLAESGSFEELSGQAVRHDVAGLSAVCPMESGKGGLSDDSVSTKALCPLPQGRGGQHQGHVVLCAAKHLLHAASGAFVPAGGRHHGRHADGGANPVLCHRLHCGGAVYRDLHTA